MMSVDLPERKVAAFARQTDARMHARRALQQAVAGAAAAEQMPGGLGETARK